VVWCYERQDDAFRCYPSDFPSHPSSLAVLDHQSHLVRLGLFHTNDELLELAGACQPTLIAIGSPLCLPAGLPDLEPACHPPDTPPEYRGRQLERELGSLGIPCFFTGRDSIIRELIYRGIGLSGALQRRGYEVIEVYPHTTKVILFGEQVLPRKGSRSLASLQERLDTRITGLKDYRGNLNKNNSDALLNAYTALLHLREGTDLLGDPQEGLLIIPTLLQRQGNPNGFLWSSIKCTTTLREVELDHSPSDF
jgi:predicted nuclease with RNAse H fold